MTDYLRNGFHYIPAIVSPDNSYGIFFVDEGLKIVADPFSSSPTETFTLSTGGAVSLGADLGFIDNKKLKLGTGDDVTMYWDATNLLVLPATDDTGIFKFGNGTLDMDVRMTLGAAADYAEFDVGNKAVELAGDVRLDLSGATVAAANTDGGVIKAGTSSTPVTEDTANMKFMSFYFDDGATSGEAIGQYLRLYVTGVGGEGIAGRFFTTVSNVAATNARGIHASLSFGTTGGVTGLATAIEATLHIPNNAGVTGTISAIKAAINSDGSTSDPVGSRLSVLNIVNQGDSTGAADVDDDCALFDFQGWTVGDGNMIAVDNSPGAMPNATHSIRLRLPDGSAAYMYLGATALTA